jgi:hypothetical protein
MIENSSTLFPTFAYGYAAAGSAGCEWECGATDMASSFRVVAASVLAVVVAAIAGCASGTPKSRPMATTGHSQFRRGSSSGQLTSAEARQVFNAFLPRFQLLPLDYSNSAAERLTTGAELRAQLFFRGQAGPTITRLTGETFYVPRLIRYPRWFWAVGQQGGANPAGRLFVMVQSSPSSPWKTAMALYDLDSTAGMLHQLATSITEDGQGYSEAVPADDQSLDVTPAALPATYASYLNDRAIPAVRRLFQSGPNTTGYIAFDRQITRGSGRYGWRDTDHQAPDGLGVYALRISTGGAIVIFSTYDTVSWQAESSRASLPARPSPAEANYVPPAFVLQRLAVSAVAPGTRLTVTAVDRVLAFVQLREVGYIYPLIFNGAATGVAKVRR